jgi:hypothetical protein
VLRSHEGVVQKEKSITKVPKDFDWFDKLRETEEYHDNAEDFINWLDLT